MKPQKLKELEELSRPLIKFINDNYHPHVKIIIDGTSSELVEGLMCCRTEDYIND